MGERLVDRRAGLTHISPYSKVRELTMVDSMYRYAIYLLMFSV